MYMRKALVVHSAFCSRASLDECIGLEQGEQSVTRFFVSFSKRLMIIGAVMFFCCCPNDCAK